MLRALDIFRKTHDDFVRKTTRGALLSVIAGLCMLTLLFFEIAEFTKTAVDTAVIIDPNSDLHLRISFNVTMLTLPCDDTRISMHDVFGTKIDDFLKNVEKRCINDNRKIKQTSECTGCELAGYLLVHRVPGEFRIEARSDPLSTTGTNASHIVNHYSFGPAGLGHKLEQVHANQQFPEFSHSSAPLDSKTFVDREKRPRSFHHFSNVVSTHFKLKTSIVEQVAGSVFREVQLRGSLGEYFRESKDVLSYQVVSQSQDILGPESEAPQVQFAYDLSPMALVVSVKSRRWYDFATSVLAIIGGSAATVRLIGALLQTAKLLRSSGSKARGLGG